jgi:hypothetical protein
MDQSEFWTILMERAYERVYPNYTSAYKNPANALSFLTGQPIQYALDPQAMQSALANGGIVVAGSKIGGTSTIVTNHAYTVTSVFQQNGQWMVTVRNPWGHDNTDAMPNDGADDGYLTMTWSAFLSAFAGVWYTEG